MIISGVPGPNLTWMEGMLGNDWDLIMQEPDYKVGLRN